MSEGARRHLHVVTTTPVTTADARAAVEYALKAIASGRLIDIDGRPGYLELTYQDSLDDGGIHVTVCDADEPYAETGPDFVVLVKPLAYCTEHGRYFIESDRLCTECVLDQVREDR